MENFSNCIKKVISARIVCHLDYLKNHSLTQNRIAFSVFMKLELVTVTSSCHRQIVFRYSKQKASSKNFIIDIPIAVRTFQYFPSCY